MSLTLQGSNTPTAGGVSYGDGANVAFTTAGTTGQVLTSAGSATPTWSTPISTSTTQTFTATQTFNGSSTTEAIKILNGAESANIINFAPPGNTTIWVANGAVQYYTANSTANWNVNITFASTTTMASAMSVGDSISIAMLTSQGSSAYYPTTVKVDGNSIANTYWQGGTAPSGGNASGIDVYIFTVLKTSATPTYTVLASQTQF
jgi:hypothetical protein